MVHLTDSRPPKPGTSRFSKVLPAIPGVTISKPDPMPSLPPKDLPELPAPPPPPPHRHGLNSSLPPSPSPASPANSNTERPPPPPKKHSTDRLAAPASQRMAIPRRPVGVDKTGMLSPQAEPSPTASISSLISAYSRPFESPTASSSASQLPTPSTSSRDTSPASRNYDLHTPLGSKVNSSQSSVDRILPPVPPKHNSAGTESLGTSKQQKHDSSDAPPQVPSKSELWRRRPQNDSRELPGLELYHSHGSTASTQRPSTALKSPPSNSSLNSTPRPRQPPSVGGLPGRNIKPNHAARDEIRLIESNSRPSVLQNKGSAMSLTQQTVRAPGPAANGPPTPEYQKDEVKVPVTNTVVSPDSPASSPQSPAKPSATMSKQLPPPPVNQTQAPSSDIPRRKPAASSPRGLPASSNAKIQSAEALQPSSSDTSLVTARTSASDSSGATPRSSDQSQDSSRSPSRQLQQKAPMDQTPRQRPPMEDPRIVHSEEHGPMYRGRDGTLYPEMKNLREPDPRAFKFPIWKGEPVHGDAIISARAVRESHHKCFQKHRAMNRRVNRNYPLTCQTCNKADSEDRYACSFCHLRICEPCFKVFSNNQRNLSDLVDQLARQTPLSLSSSSRPTSAFGLQAGA